ncbi:hypothetical protein O9929_19520 [Vibrio lentus]|nr:hypothetical protein [Vibrio lentus]
MNNGSDKVLVEHSQMVKEGDVIYTRHPILPQTTESNLRIVQEEERSNKWL